MTMSLPDGIQLVQYNIDKEDDYLPHIRSLISKDLSEPYSIYVYRYFLNTWPQLCYMLLDSSTEYPHPIGVIVCKLEPLEPTSTNKPAALFNLQQRNRPKRGYIAMLAISSSHRGRGLGTLLAQTAITGLQGEGAHTVALETEEDNGASLRLYRRLGFVRSKHLHRYYLNGKGAFRLVRALRRREEEEEDDDDDDDEEEEEYDVESNDDNDDEDDGNQQDKDSEEDIELLNGQVQRTRIIEEGNTISLDSHKPSLAKNGNKEMHCS